MVEADDHPSLIQDFCSVRTSQAHLPVGLCGSPSSETSWDSETFPKKRPRAASGPPVPGGWNS